MKPYTGNTTCPKCKIRWKAYTASLKYCDDMQCHMLTPNWRRQHISSFEHLHCTCPGCGYEWLMECVDAEEDEPPEPTTVYCPVDVDCPHCTERIELVVTSEDRDYNPRVIITSRA